MKKKELLNKIISFGMRTCIESYRSGKKDREKTRRLLESGGSSVLIAKYSRSRELDIDLFNLNRVSVLVFALTFALTTSIIHFLIVEKIMSSSFLASLLIILLSFAFTRLFRKAQIKYLLNEFKTIDNIDTSEENRIKENNKRILQEQEKLKQKIAACNLYLK